jgi:hypothetical protein
MISIDLPCVVSAVIFSVYIRFSLFAALLLMY